MKNFIFFVSYYEAIKELPEDQQGAVYKAIVNYAMEGIEPKLKGLANSIFVLIRPYIDSSKKKQNSGSMGGIAKKLSSKTSSKAISIKDSEHLSKEGSKFSSTTPSKKDSEVASNQIIKNEYEDKEEILFKKEINKEKNTVLSDSELLSLIEKNFSDEDVCQKFKEYAEMRKAMGKNKAIRTTATFESCVKKLRTLAKTKQEALEVLDYSISNCYQGLFALKRKSTKEREMIPYAN